MRNWCLENLKDIRFVDSLSLYPQRKGKKVMAAPHSEPLEWPPRRGQVSRAPRPCCWTSSSEGNVCIWQKVQRPAQGRLVQWGSSRSPDPRALPAHQPASKPAESTTLTHTQSAFPGLPFLNGHINYCPFFLVIIWNTFFFFFQGFHFLSGYYRNKALLKPTG